MKYMSTKKASQGKVIPQLEFIHRLVFETLGGEQFGK
jgi:hypothetical protein